MDQQNKSFISLAEFLCLADPYDPKYLTAEFFRSHWRITPRAENWPKYYELAKKSFEKYGQEGPPLGCEVITLQSGHCGSGGDIRVFDGVFSRDERCFQIYDPAFSKKEDSLSLVPRAIWWADIFVLEDGYNWREWRWMRS